MVLSSVKKLQSGYEPIPGYQLEEKIGRGGFGEVWRADAPGGIKKAVKFVFGDPADQRAERELKSLQRIKGIQHPFLLALERFEIVDGQLVIVTELADGSLEEVFKQHRDRGSCGIPRKMLVEHLHDAADALDYLHQKFQLQHLDIKPGNLLLVGGHVKVADFGLLKDLREADCSMIGGLTPIYAPPELFDGRPSMHSDQYSLAVMYQELLTGVRPFSGRTIAQLATQHVHNAPNLEPLPPSDQPVIAQALEKNPDRRYPTCREFVEALRDANRRGPSVESREPANRSGHPALGIAPCEVENLPQLDALQENTNAHSRGPAAGTPVLMVGLGGAGAQAVALLRRQLAHSADTPISLHALSIDTDNLSLREVRTIEPTKGTRWCQALHTPLKPAKQYRERAAEHLKTISRRWLYNVPRSLKTEGMRPLGRLALVDHAYAVTEELKRLVQSVLESASHVPPQVFVVASTCGGTASGMYLDVVHVLRHCLDEVGLENSNVISLLLSPAMRSDPRRPLILHDTQALLTEIRQFLQPGHGYPGDLGAGWKSIPASRTPLRDAYVITESTDPGMPSPVQTACDYMWLHGTGASELLQSARVANTEAGTTLIPTAAVRTVGVIQLCGAKTREQKLLAATAAHRLLIEWLGSPGSARQNGPLIAARMRRRAKISWGETTSAIIRMLAEERQTRRNILMTFLRSLSQETLGNENLCRRCLTDFILAQTGEYKRYAVLSRTIESMQRDLCARLHDRTGDLTAAIESVRIVIAGVQQEIQTIEQHGGREQPRGGEPKQTLEPASADDSLESINVSSPTNSPPRLQIPSIPGESNHSLADLRRATEWGEEILAALASDLALDHLRSLVEVLHRLQERLCDGATKVAQAIQTTAMTFRGSADPWTSLSSSVRDALTPLLLQVHGRLAPPWLVKLLSDAAATVDPVEMSNKLSEAFQDLVSDEACLRERHGADTQDVSSMNLTADPETTCISSSTSDSGDDLARTSMFESLATNGIDSLTVTSGLSDVNRDLKQAIPIRPLTIEDALRAVRPPLLDCGGRQRMLLLVGAEAEKNQYEASARHIHNGELTVATIPGCIPTLVHEAQGIQIDEILKRLQSLTGYQDEISRRLASRCDLS